VEVEVALPPHEARLTLARMDEVKYIDNVAVDKDNPDWRTCIVRMDPAAASVYVPLHAVVADGQAYYSPQKAYLANLVWYVMPRELNLVHLMVHSRDCCPLVQRHIVG